ncbi:uncharacterized protein LOC121259774 [Juglans microcarpa x Juglans regia]|uniref:uncharacterized protein LOC121259774 n=1 Tax=Juglans microcarpa x Juglans regia TaxID=2249226 RepID=UPI001B7E1876|nr:uncharacterized protein LOC121259774 [Juglans microcarpa x Juglans regia]
MFDGILKSKFYSKCKSNLKLVNTRLEGIMKKRKAVQKYLKNDVADLLRSGLDINAYGRAEGLLVEQNMSTCYEFIEKLCGCITSHLSIMHKQRDCPEECKEAVASLIYAAARFADLPELRDLRAMFTEKYGNSLDSFTSKEFVAKLRSNPPTKDMKLQLLKDIAQETNIEWDSKGLEQKLYTSPKQENPKCGSSSDDDDRWQKSKDDGVPERYKQKTGSIPSNGRGFITNRNDRCRMPSSSEDETTTDLSKNSSSSVGSVSEDEVEIKKPLSYKSPPYHKKRADKNESSSVEPVKFKSDADEEEARRVNEPVIEDKLKPKSVRRRNLKPPPGYGVTEIDLSGTKQEDARQESGGEYKRRNRTTSDLDPPLARAASTPLELTSTEATKRHVRASSLQPEMLSIAGHVHPKLPEYDELAARVAALRGR